MGSIGLFYSILQTHLTNAWLDHRLKLRVAVYGIGASLPIIASLPNDQLWTHIYVFVIVTAACTILLPLLYGFLKLEQLSAEEVEFKRQTRAAMKIEANRDTTE